MKQKTKTKELSKFHLGKVLFSLQFYDFIQNSWTREMTALYYNLAINSLSKCQSYTRESVKAFGFEENGEPRQTSWQEDVSLAGKRDGRLP